MPATAAKIRARTARGGTHEKDVTLAIARKLKAKIDDLPNMRAMLTRDGDYFIPLGQRVDKARKVQADLFVSIHADAFVEAARARLVGVRAVRKRRDQRRRALAGQKENEADLIGGVNLDGKDRYLARTLLDLSQTATINDSLKLGNAVLSEMGGINTLHKAAVEQAGFAVLKAPDIPSILVETAFISNPEEERGSPTTPTRTSWRTPSSGHQALPRQQPAAGASDHRRERRAAPAPTAAGRPKQADLAPSSPWRRADGAGRTRPRSAPPRAPRSRR